MTNAGEDMTDLRWQHGGCSHTNRGELREDRRARRDGERRAARLREALLYVCTPLRPDLADFADAAFAGGVDVLQLRDKHAEALALLAAARGLRAIADRHGALFAVNDRPDVALAAGADICHLGQGDLPQRWARSVVGAGMLLGRSTHSFSQAQAAVAEQWDYLAVGPVYETATKPGRAATGLALVRAVADLRPPQPWFAIGGIDRTTIASVTAEGGNRVVVVRAITEAPDPADAARSLRALLPHPRP